MGFLSSLTGGVLGGDTESFLYKDSRVCCLSFCVSLFFGRKSCHSHSKQGKHGCVEGPDNVHTRIGGSPKHIKKNICCNDRGYSKELKQLTQDSLGVRVFVKK
eukprot:TRINITY_DN3153_c0_g1_i1.p1 TRINITY_DN3153_c0_g1~~TRINITY_DN3153_c0_g1_i1.p1  ORF type:complete len:103 (+),score=11.90 TRINITY_DN3153_c0_g1_i1:158-466(+)